MKKLRLCAAAALLAVFTLTACGGGKDVPEAADACDEQEPVAVTLWVFPVGNWGNPTAVSSLLSGFHKQYPDINVTVEYLNYENGDEKIARAIAEGRAPDMVFEGPERLVADWGDQGLMVDLSDLWELAPSDQIYENVRKACRHENGAYYEYPVCMSAHCMAINYDLFRDTGALAYIDEENHTWTTEDFIAAVETLRASGQERVGLIYCKNQSGDQGTRALVNNLCGGSFTDEGHTPYMVDSGENITALQLLYALEGITFEPDLSSGDAVKLFCSGETAMSFCWNVSLEIQQTINNPDLDFEVFPMAFPSATGEPRLQGGIWGFGIFDNGDDRRIEASGTFIRYMTEEDSQYTRAVHTSTYWPVRDIGNIYVNDMLMEEYSIFTPYMGDYYQVTPGWAQARTAWWKLLQEIGGGADIREAVKGFPAET